MGFFIDLTCCRQKVNVDMQRTDLLTMLGQSAVYSQMSSRLGSSRNTLCSRATSAMAALSTVHSRNRLKNLTTACSRGVS